MMAMEDISKIMLGDVAFCDVASFPRGGKPTRRVVPILVEAFAYDPLRIKDPNKPLADPANIRTWTVVGQRVDTRKKTLVLIKSEGPFIVPVVAIRDILKPTKEVKP
jgi:hypothetical protein